MSDQEKVVNETEKEEIEQEIPESTDVAEEITEPQSDSKVVFEIAENKSLKDKIKNIFSKNIFASLRLFWQLLLLPEQSVL